MIFYFAAVLNAYNWLNDEKQYVYVSQDEEPAAFTDFFMKKFAVKQGGFIPAPAPAFSYASSA